MDEGDFRAEIRAIRLPQFFCLLLKLVKNRQNVSQAPYYQSQQSQCLGQKICETDLISPNRLPSLSSFEPPRLTTLL